MKILLYGIIMISPLIGKTQILQDSQAGQAGIQWTDNLSWDQVKEKAKAEEKYIFLDCFATWCGPCKQMDKNVYANDSVGDYFNQRFIAVKVQIDRTQKDNEQVQRRYQDAKIIAKEYRIEAFPTFVFLSPAGVVVHKENGYKDVPEFIGMAQDAIRPGKVYDDPYAEYDRLVLDYKQGIYHYDRMVYMIKAALKFDTAIARQLIKTNTEYLANLPADKRYTKDNIEFWRLFRFKSNSRTFKFFYRDGNKIDQVMNQKGYSAAVVDETIFNEMVLPFMEQQNKNKSIAMSGMYVGGKMLKRDYSEANWKVLSRMIKQQFNRKWAKRNVVAAKVEWYKRHNNDPAVVKNSLIQLKKYPPLPSQKADMVNEVGWKAFLHIENRKMLNKIIFYTQQEAIKTTWNDLILDTHANLLYKVGRKEEAVSWEQKAISWANKLRVEEYKKAKEQMKRGEPTYGVKPL